MTCHTVHDRGGDGMAYYMTRTTVARECRACHPGDRDPTIAPEPSYAGVR